MIALEGEAGLPRREMIALEWGDIDLKNRAMCVQRSDWSGHLMRQFVCWILQE